MLEGEFGRRDRELSIAVQPFQAVRRKKFFRLPVQYFCRAGRFEDRRIEGRDRPDPWPLICECGPKLVFTDTDRGNQTDSCYDDALQCFSIRMFRVSSITRGPCNKNESSF